MLHQKSTPSLQYINILHERIFSKIQINKINFYSIKKREHLKHTIKKSKFHNLSKFIIFLLQYIYQRKKIHLDIKFSPIKQKKKKKQERYYNHEWYKKFIKTRRTQSTPIAEEQEAGPVGKPVGNRRESQQEGGYNYYSDPVPLIFVSAGINPRR